MSFVVENSPEGVMFRIYVWSFNFVTELKFKLLSGKIKSVVIRSESNDLLRVSSIFLEVSR